MAVRIRPLLEGESGNANSLTVVEEHQEEAASNHGAGQLGSSSIVVRTQRGERVFGVDQVFDSRHPGRASQASVYQTFCAPLLTAAIEG